MSSPLGKVLLEQADPSGASPVTASGDANNAKRPAATSDGSEAGERPLAKALKSERDQPPPAPAVFKFLAPEMLSNALEAFAPIIGEAAGGELDLTDSSDPFPGTGCRTACLVADNMAGIIEGMKKVLSIVAQCGGCASNRAGEFFFTAVMPAKSCAMLIGVKGQNIKDLVKTSGAHVHVEGEALGFSTGGGPGGDKLVQVKGSYSGLESAVIRLVECVLEFQDQPWFPDWVVRTNAERCETPSEDGEDKGGKGVKTPKAAALGKASVPANDAGTPPSAVGDVADMAAIAASMCGMMMPMQCMQLMGVGSMPCMPLVGMGGMPCLPFMGMAPMIGMGDDPDTGNADLNGPTSGDLNGRGSEANASGLCANGLGTGGVAGVQGLQRVDSSTGAMGCAGKPNRLSVGGANTVARADVPGPIRTAGHAGAVSRALKKTDLNNIPAGIIARQVKGTLNVGKSSVSRGVPRSTLPAAHVLPKNNHLNLVAKGTGRSVLDPLGSESENAICTMSPAAFADDDLLSEEEMALKIAQQRAEIERLRTGLSHKTQLQGH